MSHSPRKKRPKIVQVSRPIETIQVVCESGKDGDLSETCDAGQSSGDQADEAGVTLGFIDWLSSVTEHINNTQQYRQCYGDLISELVYFIPSHFFTCLERRISRGTSAKKRLLPHVTTVLSDTTKPLPKMSWHITNVLHVKAIFDTPQVPLLVQKTFVENQDGTFSEYHIPSGASTTTIGCKKQLKPILPLEYKTFLDIGHGENVSEGRPFSIEWTPDVLPATRTGELRITFRFRHSYGGRGETLHLTGHSELCPPDPATAVQIVTSGTCSEQSDDTTIVVPLPPIE